MLGVGTRRSTALGALTRWRTLITRCRAGGNTRQTSPGSPRSERPSRIRRPRAPCQGRSPASVGRIQALGPADDDELGEPRR